MFEAGAVLSSKMHPPQYPAGGGGVSGNHYSLRKARLPKNQQTLL
ncbi:hypothetical protein KIS4809_4282 [Bacillus sp. ZZV12-4809]|nr:hypothetical protein KIS4809_4282 [Bacillus sp. ZZV12-4809]